MDCDVIIIGAGPIGLMLANLLGKNSIKTIIIDKNSVREEKFKAIGITPPSLKLIKELNLEEAFLKNGVKIQTVKVHGSKKNLGTVSFKNLPGRYQYILSVPQYNTELLLEQNLKSYKEITFYKGYECINIAQKKESVTATIINHRRNKEEQLTARYLCACDGGKSLIRSLLSIPFKGARYRDTFLMGEYHDTSGLDNEAHLFFTSKGSVESFPLPGKIRRWVIQTPRFIHEPNPSYLEFEVAARSGFTLDTNNLISLSPFGVQHYINKHYYKGNILFSGDAAHVISPIGGQGMNTGFADTEFLAYVLNVFINDDGYSHTLLHNFEHCRKKAVKTAIRRSETSMNIGTIKGSVPSVIRNALITVLLHSPLKKLLPPFFSMLTIPYCDLEKVRRKKIV